MTIEIAQIISRAWASKRPDETVSAWTCKWGGLVANRPADIYLFKVNKKRVEKGVNFEHISHFFLVFLLLPLNK